MSGTKIPTAIGPQANAGWHATSPGALTEALGHRVILGAAFIALGEVKP